MEKEEARKKDRTAQRNWDRKNMFHIGVNVNINTCPDVIRKWKALDNKAERFIHWIRSL